MRWQLASTFALTAMSAACYGPNRIVCEKDGVATGILCPDNLECTGNTGSGEVLCAKEVDLEACAVGVDRERTPCSSTATANGLCIANVCTSCDGFPDDFECRYTEWTQMVSPAMKLTAIWVEAPNSAYAVGSGDGVTLHYDGKTWKIVASIPGANLQGVWSDNGDVFVISFNGDVYRNLSATPSMATAGLRGIWGTSIADVIAVGTRTVFGRWTGTSWIWSVAAGGLTPPTWEGVGGAGDAIIAMSTQADTDSQVAMFTGSGFTALAPLPAGYERDVLKSVWGTSASDFYVVGTRGTDSSLGVIHHYVGGAWAVPVAATQELTGVWGSDGKVYAVGNNGLIATLGNAAWSEQTIGTQHDLKSIYGADGDAMAVSAEGTIWRISPPRDP